MVNDKRKALIVKEPKSKIDKIRKKFKNPEMSEETAIKIGRLETLNKILKTATIVCGIITAIDLLPAPDDALGPIGWLDEAFLTAATVLLKQVTTYTENKIEKLANSEDASLTPQEVEKLAAQISKLVKTGKRK